MVKFQFFGLKSFEMGFKLKEIVSNSLVFTIVKTPIGITKFLDYALPLMRISIYHRVFSVTFDKLKLGNLMVKLVIINLTMRGCMIATKYIEFIFPCSFCRRRVISFKGVTIDPTSHLH